jgi:hypothetical protein
MTRSYMNLIYFEDPPNGAVGIVGWGQIGIILIGMMALMLMI